MDDVDGPRAILSSDTSAAAEAIQVRAWRSMAQLNDLLERSRRKVQGR